MSMSINELRIAGFVGADPKVGQTQNGKTYAMFNLCHTQRGDKEKNIPDKSTWVRVKCFGWSAENAKVFKKGDNVIAFGSLEVNNYKDKEGAEKTSIDLFAHQVGKIDVIKKEEKQSQPNFDDISSIPF